MYTLANPCRGFCRPLLPTTVKGSSPSTCRCLPQGIMWSIKQVQIPSKEWMHKIDFERCGMYGMTTTALHVSGSGIRVGWGEAVANQICLNIAPDRDIEEKQDFGALTNNGCPSGLMKWYWQPPPEPNTCRAVVVIPYLQHLSESNRHILSPLGMSISLRAHNTPTCV